MTLGLLDPASSMVVLSFWAAWGLGIWAIVHAARTPDVAWRAVAGTRVAWILGILVTNFLVGALVPLLPFIGLVVSISYLSLVRPTLSRAAAAAHRESTVS